MSAVWWPEARTGDLVTYLDDQEHTRLLAVTEVAEAGPGDFLLHKGSPSRSILLVEEGEIEVVDESLGETVVLGRAGPGSVVGEVGFLDGQVRTHHVRASTACRVRRLTREGLLALAAAEPLLFAKVSIALARLVTRRFRSALEELDPLRSFAASLGDPEDNAAAGPAGSTEAAREAGDDEGPVQYDEIDDPLLDQALDVLRELARRPGKDLAGV
ncbi:MAG TPA: cyclic nucleotide-binding domain-containing protein [Vicinamibacteria bacterium]|nr:cyclic nucleotide-binding domain-containing protein [Vicinamibacteria bacterium]